MDSINIIKEEIFIRNMDGVWIVILSNVGQEHADR